MDCRYRQEMVQARQQEIMAAKRQEIAEARATARAQANMMNMNADAVSMLNQPIGSSVGNMMADLIKMQAQALARSAQFQQSTGLYKKCPKFSIFATSLTSIDSFYLSLVVKKTVLGVSDQVRHKPGCTSLEDG